MSSRLAEHLRQLRASFDRTWQRMEEAFAGIDREIDREFDAAFSDVESVADHDEKTTVTEETRPDGTRVVTKTKIRRITRTMVSK